MKNLLAKKSRLALYSLILTIACLFAFSLPVFADGDTRLANPAERAYYQSVVSTFAKAVPAAGPNGWRTVDKKTATSIDRVTVGAEDYPMSVNYYIAWEDSKKKQMADTAAEQALLNNMQNNGSNPEADRLNKKIEALAAELGKAIDSGDMDKAQRIMAEMEALGAEREKIFSANDNRQNSLLEQNAAHDATLRITITANSFSDEFYRPAREVPSIAGGLTIRTDGTFDPNRGWSEGSTYVFLGNGWSFAPSETGGSTQTASANKPYTAVHTIIVQVQADEARAQEYLSRIDWNALQRLL